MLPLTICISLITYCFANELTPHVHHQKLPINQEIASSDIPKDYLDSMGLPNPDYKFSYMFEQKRTDEVPQVEQIEENIGKYMAYPPTTTTATTKPQQNINAFNENFKELAKTHGVFKTPIIVLETHRKHHHHHKVNKTIPTTALPAAPKLEEPSNEIRPHFPTHSWDNWNDQSAYPAKMPPAPVIPKWEELTEVLKHYPHPKLPHARTLNRHHRIHKPSKASETPDDVAELSKNIFDRDYFPQAPSTRPPLSPSQLNKDMSSIIKPEEITNKPFHKHAPQHVHRGSYKFGLDDDNDMDTSDIPSTTLVNESKSKERRRSPPPPVPTLSPWYDGYGK